MRRNEALILANTSLVDRIAGSLSRRLLGEYEEFRSAGIVGLIEAADRFDPSHGVPFRKYASPRVHGAIVDHHRMQDTLPRRYDLRRIASHLRGDRFYPYRTRVMGKRGEAAIAGATDDAISSHSTAHSQQHIVGRLLSELPFRLRCIMRMYHFEEKTDGEIARVYGVTAGRICQLRREAEKLLRGLVQKHGITLDTAI